MYSKTCLKPPLQKGQKLVFMTVYHFMKVQCIAECSNGSILQYFQPSLSYHFPLSIFKWPLKTGFTESSFSVENIVDYDKMALSEVSWTGSTSFSKKDKSWFSRTRVKINKIKLWKLRHKKGIRLLLIYVIASSFKWFILFVCLRYIKTLHMLGDFACFTICWLFWNLTFSKTNIIVIIIL